MAPAYTCSLRVTDDDSNVVTSSVIINVVNYQIIPLISTSQCSVSINDSVFLMGSTLQVSPFDTIVKWEWDIGNTGNFVSSPDSTFLFVAPLTPNSNFMCVLKITDNKGLAGLDTVVVNVLLDAPVCTASTTTPSVSINDTISLEGTATDQYGTIITWEWDAGNTGVFTEVNPLSAYFTIAPPEANSSYLCVLRVTDDDGLVALDTVKIGVNKWVVYNTSNSGLPRNASLITIDTSGIKWIGIENNGIVKFDDLTWTHYTTSNSGLPHWTVSSIAIDRSGDKWIGTGYGGIAKFDNSNWTVYDTSNSDLPSNFIRSIVIDSFVPLQTEKDFSQFFIRHISSFLLICLY